jgi:glyoxylase-like metal-dependent hydrolase (beta-lactamase superfamily II)
MIFRQLIHDDHVSGHRPLVAATGVEIHRHRKARAVKEILHVVDGVAPAWESSGGEITRPATTRSM